MERIREHEIPHGIQNERVDTVAVWTLNRPDRRNALARSTVRELGRLAREVATDDSVRAVILTAAGNQAFCAGADLKERRGMTLDDTRDLLSLYRETLEAIDRCPKPTLAALNGVAFGGGLEFALACDFRVAASHARLGLTEVSLGIIPGAGGTQRLTRLVGPAKAKELILFAQRLEAEEARALGLLHAVAPVDADLRAFALEFLAPLRGGAPIALAAALEAIDAATEVPLTEGFAIERRCYERTLASDDRLEALAAFAEKRAPEFTGR